MMDNKVLYTNHAVKQMFSRNISVTEEADVLENGNVVIDYLDDKPFPSKLLFSKVNSRLLHVVCSYDSEKSVIIIITVYEPSADLWENDYKTRKK